MKDFKNEKKKTQESLDVLILTSLLKSLGRL